MHGTHLQIMPARCRFANLIAALASLSPALAWDKDGHEAIGMTTMSALQNGPAAQVKRLMGGKDAVDVAVWAHKVNKKYTWTTALHYQRQPSWQCKKVEYSHCPGNKCLLKAVKHLYGRLVNQSSDDDQIDWGEGVKLTDADCLKYLINLLGDLHQPLHLGFDEGDIGKNTSVMFRGRSMTLFDVWDEELTQAVMKDSPGFWWGGWTHVQRTRSEFEKDNARWKAEGVKMLDEWASESLKFACEDVYRNPISKKLVSEEAKEHGGVFHLDQHLFEVWKREMLSKMLVAGARTAIVLNSILLHRPDLHGGSGVAELEGEEVEAAEHAAISRRNGHKHDPGHRHMTGFQAFTINLVVFSAVFVIFVYLMRAWTDTSAVEAATKAKAQNSGKKT